MDVKIMGYKDNKHEHFDVREIGTQNLMGTKTS